MTLAQEFEQATLRVGTPLVPFTKKLAAKLDELDSLLEPLRKKGRIVPTVKGTDPNSYAIRMEACNGTGDFLRVMADMAGACDRLDAFLKKNLPLALVKFDVVDDVSIYLADQAAPKRRGRPRKTPEPQAA